MTELPRKWDDLGPRALSAAAMILVGLVTIWLGGVWFGLVVALAGAVMIWELARMLGPEWPEAPAILGVLTFLVFPLAWFSAYPALAILAALASFGVIWIRHARLIFLGYGAAIMLACFAILWFRGIGMVWVFWLVCVVVASDTAGYFAGKRFGGPKFWPRVSPKKTWSGTVAGWIGAAAMGVLFLPLTGAGWSLVLVSALAGFAAQIGDIAESAIKRRCGIKDASNILPGHGGVMDRFDGMVGAILIALLFFALGWLTFPVT